MDALSTRTVFKLRSTKYTSCVPGFTASEAGRRGAASQGKPLPGAPTVGSAPLPATVRPTPARRSSERITRKAGSPSSSGVEGGSPPPPPPHRCSLLFHARAVTCEDRQSEVRGAAAPGGAHSAAHTVPLPATVEMAPLAAATYRTRAHPESKISTPALPLAASAAGLLSRTGPPGLFTASAPSPGGDGAVAGWTRWHAPASTPTVPLGSHHFTQSRPTWVVKKPPPQSGSTKLG